MNTPGARCVVCVQVPHGEALPDGAHEHFESYRRAPVLPLRGVAVHHHSAPLTLDAARALVLDLAAAGLFTMMEPAQ